MLRTFQMPLVLGNKTVQFTSYTVSGLNAYLTSLIRKTQICLASSLMKMDVKA